MVTENNVIGLLPINRAIEVVERAFIDYATDLIMVGKTAKGSMISQQRLSHLL